MKKIIFLMPMLLFWATSLCAQTTREQADAIMQKYLPNDVIQQGLLYVNVNTPGEGDIVITTSNEEIIKPQYACWAYYLNESESDRKRYFFVKENNGNLLEVVAHHDLGPDDLSLWKLVEKTGFTRIKADEIVLEYMSRELRQYGIYAQENIQTEGSTITTSTGEILELDYSCWVYYIRYSDDASGFYLIVKDSNGNLLKINATNDVGPEDLETWRRVDLISNEFAPIGAEWYYTYSSITPLCCYDEKSFTDFNHIISEKDTIIEGNTCRVLSQYYYNSYTYNSTVSGKYIIKQEQGKVYYYYQDQFNLLFDFDAQVNDIVEFTFMYSKHNYDDIYFITIKDTILSVRYLVEDITVDAQLLKTFTTKGIDDINYGDGIYSPPYIYTYTEKIGLHSKFMPEFDNGGHPDMVIHRWLRCYADAGVSFVSNWWAATDLPCNYICRCEYNTPQDEKSQMDPNSK